MNIKNLKIIIFDLDGVITSEYRYWDTARLTTWNLIFNSDFLGLTKYFNSGIVNPEQVLKHGQEIIPENFIDQLKRRAINSNWDLTFFIFCLHLISILYQYPSFIPEEFFNRKEQHIQKYLEELGSFLQKGNYNIETTHSIIEKFWEETSSLTGMEVINYIPIFAKRMLGYLLPIFDFKSSLWKLCYDEFQNWYNGRKGFYLPRDGTVLDLQKINETLYLLSEKGNYELAIATGRPRLEVMQPLSELNILKYFSLNRIVTYDEVINAENLLSKTGKNDKLGKPHPFVLLKAIYPESKIEKIVNQELLNPNHQHVAYVGDSVSDIVASQRAGCFSIGVLTGFSKNYTQEQKRDTFKQLGCNLITNDISELPQFLIKEN